MADTCLEISSSLYWWWWSRGSCSSSRWSNLACCGNLTRVWKWVTLKTPVCLTKQLDSASTGLRFRFAGIQTNGPKLALRDSEICCGQPNKMHSICLARFMRSRPPSACAQGAKKRLQATKRALSFLFLRTAAAAGSTCTLTMCKDSYLNRCYFH
jgi:hypothetical protein